MHIAFLTSEYPHAKISNSAGIGTSIKNLAVTLVNKGNIVTVFIYGTDCNDVFEDSGIIIHKITYKKYKFLSWYLYRKQLETYINKIIKNDQIDILEAPDWTGITAFMKFKCPLLIRLHGTDAYFCNLEGRKQKWKNYFFEKKALKSADYITAVSEFTAKKTAEIFKLHKTIKVIYNGIDIHNFSNLKVEVVKNSILYFGSMIRKKGVLELAYIFNEVINKKPSSNLILVGKDVIDIFEKKSTVQLFMNRLSKEAKKKVIYKSEVPYSDVKQYIANTSVIVLPSFAEAFPMTWLEAMSMEKALVTSNIGWANELMINGKTGFMENPKAHQLYADKILQLLNNQKLNSAFGKKAKQRIETSFSQDLIGKQNIEFFKSIIKDK
ncbi:glycosyltransferase family 4 protein [Lutibacter flavus]|uniref:Glycosyltransferase involved in cell wall bisynthesis n=1 Tax=Lutibacter flavus TaxID=691689 RepID=A0A238VRR8_9FLAO|nr:glycosyltransferase family 4 protein [Lutibacter flavus]SNR36493.1 Glycosyltransferase involved in cell wall bisynthesis [Lutibacter flavus]